MKKLLLILLFAELICNFKLPQCQVNQALTYFPLKTGNVWVYRCTAYGIPPTCVCILRKYRYQITGTIVRNNKTYFLFQSTEASITCNNCYAPYLSDTLRIDSATGNIFKYSYANGCNYSPFEIMYDSLNARLNDTIRNNCAVSQWRYKCTDTSNQNVLGTIRKTKSFNESQFESSYGRSFAQGIGIIGAGISFVFCNINYSTLIGCVIDGVLYGDTSMLVGIYQISSEIPEKFSLLQNYPNPFNPVTTIRFDVPAVGSQYIEPARLIVYDILGREVTTLVNEQLKPGTYEVEWDASNYPSGVYFYKLISYNFSESKKMVLIK